MAYSGKFLLKMLVYIAAVSIIGTTLSITLRISSNEYAYAYAYGYSNVYSNVYFRTFLYYLIPAILCFPILFVDYIYKFFPDHLYLLLKFFVFFSLTPPVDGRYQKIPPST